ncbi:hypothetical protein L208DRAFT_1369370 [Tricholoma matsutake]|nr:hypothetical protein L208DRAFT_1369370 [Tricholoma matsutake 945]
MVDQRAPPPVLHFNPETVQQAHQTVALAKEADRRTPLPNIVLGFKANAFDVSVPLKVDEAFKNFCYVPYSSLTSAAQLKAACGEEDFILNAHGGLTVKSFDCCNEKSISTVDWHAAAHAAEEQICFHHGEVHAEAFICHHKLVMDLSHSHSWDVAMEYDIQQ